MLTDFGVSHASRMSKGLLHQGQIAIGLGTHGFRAPEQADQAIHSFNPVRSLAQAPTRGSRSSRPEQPLAQLSPQVWRLAPELPLVTAQVTTRVMAQESALDPASGQLAQARPEWAPARASKMTVQAVLPAYSTAQSQRFPSIAGLQVWWAPQ